MATVVSAPATYSQPSRKGKRAWCKNIDLEDVAGGLETARDEYRNTGGQLIKDLAANQLFQTDVTGDQHIRVRAEKQHGKLKADEILAARSKIPAVETRKTTESKITDGVLKRKRDSALSAKERGRLWRLANSGGSAANHGVVELSESASYDPWAAPEPELLDRNQSFLESAKPIHEPITLREKPISMTSSGKAVPSVPKPHAGRSYNPQFEAWSTLLESEGNKEVAAEKLRQQVEAKEQERQERLAIAAAEADREDQDRAVMSEYESDWEGFQSEFDEAQLISKRPERKTPAERNKIKRRKAAEALERHERMMKLRDQQLRQIDEITAAANRKHKSRVWGETFDGFSSEESADEGLGQESVDLAKRPRLGKKFRAPDQDLELVLPDELKESLRLLRPEGNLLKDRYRNMILQGRTEGRTPIPMQKKPRRKATEKWSYKDWTLDNA